jgi:hypothetical protein
MRVKFNFVFVHNLGMTGYEKHIGFVGNILFMVKVREDKQEPKKPVCQHF